MCKKVPANGGKHHGSNAQCEDSNGEGKTKGHMARTSKHCMPEFLQHQECIHICFFMSRILSRLSKYLKPVTQPWTGFCPLGEPPLCLRWERRHWPVWSRKCQKCDPALLCLLLSGPPVLVLLAPTAALYIMLPFYTGWFLKKKTERTIVPRTVFFRIWSVNNDMKPGSVDTWRVWNK